MATEEVEDNGALLTKSVCDNPDDPSSQFDLGLYLWERGEKDKAAEHFVISAKLNPHNGLAFRFLGDYYHFHTNLTDTTNRALKCYQRAISLNPDDNHAGEILCDMLDQQGKLSLEISVCREACDKSRKAFWAFRRLGFLQVHQEQWSEAVPSFQHAIRGYPTCADLWEALGLAYQRLGMFTAAIKSFGRVIDLEDTRVFALVESGNIFLILGSFRKAVEQFQKALYISPHSASANYGLASALLGLSKECIYLGAFKWGASLLEDACKVTKATTHFAGNFSCVWKLHGDIQLTYAKCFPWTEPDWNSKLDVETFKTSIDSWRKTCYLAALSAKSSYQRALHLAPWQANIYTDIAITLDHISYLEGESSRFDTSAWQLSEKMSLGALLLEPDNYEFWVSLGCITDHRPLKQHALIRALQLDISSAFAWSYLGQLYREEGELKLARQAFDCGRSIDPSLALPWAGMAADYLYRESTLEEAFESSLRAAQLLPLADFQVGLAKLALVSGNLSSPQVFAAIQQAVQRAPNYPESHNLNGLACEARNEYQAAVASYRLAHCAISISSADVPKSHVLDISVNLIRSLCEASKGLGGSPHFRLAGQAGNIEEALQECENLNKEDLLNAEGLQIYAFCLWRLGKHDLALPVARNLATMVSKMEKLCAAAAVGFICRMLYKITGLDSTINSILKMPKEMFQNPKVLLLVYAINALDQSDRLDPIVSYGLHTCSSHEHLSRMHYLMALGKLLKYGSEKCLAFQSGIDYLRRVLHKFPNSNLLRNQLGYLLLSSEEWKDTHTAIRCGTIKSFVSMNEEGLKSACEIIGAGAIACNVIGSRVPKFSFPSCDYQCQNGPQAVQELQSTKDATCQYQKLQLLLCASEISLQSGNKIDSINHARNATALSLPDRYLFFGHLLLCRAYASLGSFENLQDEYIKCLELKTDYYIAWMCLKVIETQYEVQSDVNILELGLKECSRGGFKSGDIWMALFSFVLGLVSLRNRDFLSAEESFAQACTLADTESCFFLCHGVACMMVGKECLEPDFISNAVRSLTRAQAISYEQQEYMPIVSILLAQAEGSLGSKERWEKNLRMEWSTWPPEMRPAELYLQMHLLATWSKGGPDYMSRVVSSKSPLKWVLHAIHTNPSCSRYWKVLQKLVNGFA
ncbi:hypothetical protein ACFE04_025618 [Oxalis oulophora]